MADAGRPDADPDLTRPDLGQPQFLDRRRHPGIPDDQGLDVRAHR
jgi:hypothetical protein